MKTITTISRTTLLGLLAAALLAGGCPQKTGAGEEGCGDGEPLLPETCDDGNTVDGDGCSSTCQVEHGYVCWNTPSICRVSCGDGIMADVEGCDDGNVLNNDGCTNNCDLEFGWVCEGEPSVCHTVCGDGQMVGPEECDDGNNVDCDGCDASCRDEPTPNCGDGTMECGEQCDDGNNVDCDGCNASCELEPATNCGDGTVECGEQCDDGGESATCNDDCTEAVCGDSKVNATAGEECDDAGAETATCNDDCTEAVCGDGTINGAAAETCDDGDAVAGDGCSDTCTVEAGWYCSAEPSVCTTQCGDNVTAGPEQCDDGNVVDCDGCDASCMTEPPTNCGDGNLECGEQCDDGNLVDGDGCNASCVTEFCGDSIVHTGLGETCDEGGDTATCDGDCSAVACGDGYTNPANGEQCDDGNLVAGDGCDAACQSENLFFEDWEDGNYNGWTTGTAGSPSVTSSTAANGTSYSLNISGGTSHYEGLYRTFSSLTPSRISWYSRSSSSTDSDTYFVIHGSSSTGTTNQMTMIYFQSGGQIRVVESGASTDVIAYTANTWYHLEMRNINYTAHTFDLYIDNTNEGSFTFRNSTVNVVGRLDLYNFSGSGWWDEIAFHP